MFTYEVYKIIPETIFSYYLKVK